MAFIDITNKTGPIGVENFLTPYKRGKKEITPEICSEVLAMTNYARNIRDMMMCVLKLPKEKQRDFLSVFLSAFDGREQPEDILTLAKKLAVDPCFLWQLDCFHDDIHKKPGVFLASSFERRLCLVTMSGCWPEKEIDKLGQDFFKVRFLDYWRTDLSKSKKLRGSLEFRSEDVVLTDCDLSNVTDIQLGENNKSLYLGGATHIPENIDFSRCEKLSLYGVDLNEIKKLCFAPGAEVILDNAKNIPADLDFSMCSRVSFTSCDVGAIKKWNFNKESVAFFWKTENLPPKLDVSMCSKASFFDCDLSQVNSIRFKNRKQFEESGIKKVPDNCRILFGADEQKTQQLTAGKSLGGRL